MNKTASIYCEKGEVAYQYGNSRTLVSKTGVYQFQIFKGGKWQPGPNRHAADTIEKVKASLA